MTALLSAEKNDTAKIAFYVADCRSLGLDVLAPDVNNSEWDFTIEDRPEQKAAIRFGLGAVKNVGQGPVDLILEARRGGAFNNLNDFIQRVDLRGVGKRSLECLIKVGALDSLGPRTALLEALDQMLSVSTSHFKALLSGQLSFFGSFAESVDEIILPFAASLDTREQLEWERELLGLYVSAHPLTPYLPALRRKITHFSGQLGEAHDKEKVSVAGMVTKFRQHQTKTGKTMGFATLEDIQGPIELVLFPRTWDRYSKLIMPDRVLVVEGSVDAATGDPKILVDRMDEIDLEEALNVPEIDISAFIPPAVLAVYGEKGMPTHLEDAPFEEQNGALAEDLDDAPFEVQNGAPFEVQDGAPIEAVNGGGLFEEPFGAAPILPQSASTGNGMSRLEPSPKEPPRRVAESRPGLPIPEPAGGRIPAEEKLPAGKPAAAAWDDDGPPLWPDDWDQFEPPAEDDYLRPAQPAPQAKATMAGIVQAANDPFAQSPAETTSGRPESKEPEQIVRAQFSVTNTTPGALPSGETQPPPFLSMPFFVPTAAMTITSPGEGQQEEDKEPRQLTVILRSGSDKAHDVRRLRRIHGTLRSFPGKDKFAFLVFEGGRRFLMEFPNDTTGICSELIRKIIELVGEGNVRVEPIKIQ